MFYRQLLSAEDHIDPRPWAYAKVQDLQQRPALADDPPAVFVRSRLMTIKFHQAWLGVAKLDQLESFRGDAEMFFDLGAVNGMRKSYIKFVTDGDRDDAQLRRPSARSGRLVRLRLAVTRRHPNNREKNPVIRRKREEITGHRKL